MENRETNINTVPAGAVGSSREGCDIKETTIHAVPPDEAGNKLQRCEIRFDCLVKMYDVGYIKPTENWFEFKKPDKPSPQWFRSLSNITLESIKYADPYVIGVQIKQQFEDLERAIKQYEDRDK